MRQPLIRALAVAGLLAFSVMLAACGSDDSTATSEPAAETGGDSGSFGTGLELGETIATTPAGASVEPWVRWNSDTCSYEETDEHPAKYVAKLRTVAGGDPQVGYMHYGNKDPFGTSISKSIEAAAEEAGMPLDVYNLKFPSKTEPQVQARAAVTKQDQGVIQANIDTSVLPGFFEILQEEGCIPSIQLFIPIDETPTFGNNWPDVGALIGEYIATEGAARKWSAENTALVQCTDPAHGPAVNAMHDELEKVMDAEGFEIPEANRFRLLCKEEEPDSGYKRVTDWFTGHPEFDHVALAAIDTVRGQPMSRAVEEQDLPDEDTLIAAGADDETSRASLRKGEQDMSVAFFGERYGEWVVPMLQDILAGNPVPSFVGTELVALTADNVDQYYPE